MTLMSEQLTLDGLETPRPGPIVRQQPPTSAVVYRVGGRYYPLRTESRCVVCNSEWRTEIETALLKGRSYRVIEEGLEEDSGVTRRNIREHVKNGHLPMEVVSRTALIEERAKEMGRNLEDHAGSVVDQVTLARTVVQRTFERMAEGSMDWSVSDALKAADLLQKHELYEGSGMDAEAIFTAFRRMMESTAAVVNDEQMRAIGENMRHDPILQGVLARLDGSQDEPIEVGAG